MDKTDQLENLARALLGGLVELHGREHEAHVLMRLAEGLMAGLPLDDERRCDVGAASHPSFEARPD